LTRSQRAARPRETIHNEPFTVQPRMVAEAIRAADVVGRECKRY